jgi:murein L,D-transpeptidase YcbB/YkuD
MNEKISIQHWVRTRRRWPFGIVLSVSLVAMRPAVAAEDDTVKLAFTDSLLLEPGSQGTQVGMAGEPAIRANLAQVSTDDTAEAGQLLRAFYDRLNNTFVWQSERRVNALVEALRELTKDGLMPEDYAIENLLADYRASRSADAAGKADFDINATRRLLNALTHLQNGKTDPRRLMPDWDGPENRGLPMADITRRLLADDVAGAFERVRPRQDHYQALRQALAEYRAMDQASVAFFPLRDEALRQGDRHPDVMILRQRLTYWGATGLFTGQVEAYPTLGLESNDPELFDSELENAVKRFQRRHLLKDDGVVGRNTREALNASIASRIDQLRVNLERARWLAPVFEQQPRLWVDLAGYSLVYVRPSGERWQSRVIVGSAQRETPVIHSRVTHLTINPSWTLPPTIMREDILPQVRRDPEYLERRNMQVINYAGQKLSASEIDWNSPGNIMIRQPAGNTNPLGRVVIRFPNSDMIYLHDTPSRGLFGRERRALSSGCVRVEGVTELAQMLLEDTGSRQQLQALKNSSRSDIQVNLPERTPVALHYLTAWPDENGNITFRSDIYQRDSSILKALNQ